ncbi:hypothetical protein MJO28_003240 [Puccinia striiformis f. sp. tritici]|uniref:Uncharacterized protein n=1 Tax=Puccinia striiformis f. sp. tritici TaxID=168172 RepID=A0ACC0ESK9_9BASI|nr:hypothetical protein MJO28_003240 [Puccinia striiformis f. sp. tritici]
MTTLHERLSVVPKLQVNGSNYQTWFVMVQEALGETLGQTINLVEPDLILTDKEDTLLKTAILATVDDRIKVGIVECPSGMEAIQMIADTFTLRSRTSHITTVKELLENKFNHFDRAADLDTHFRKIENGVKHLVRSGFAITEASLIGLLFHLSLPNLELYPFVNVSRKIDMRMDRGDYELKNEELLTLAKNELALFRHQRRNLGGDTKRPDSSDTKPTDGNRPSNQFDPSLARYAYRSPDDQTSLKRKSRSCSTDLSARKAIPSPNEASTKKKIANVEATSGEAKPFAPHGLNISEQTETVQQTGTKAQLSTPNATLFDRVTKIFPATNEPKLPTSNESKDTEDAAIPPETSTIKPPAVNKPDLRKEIKFAHATRPEANESHTRAPKPIHNEIDHGDSDISQCKPSQVKFRSTKTDSSSREGLPTPNKSDTGKDNKVVEPTSQLKISPTSERNATSTMRDIHEFDVPGSRSKPCEQKLGSAPADLSGREALRSTPKQPISGKQTDIADLKIPAKQSPATLEQTATGSTIDHDESDDDKPKSKRSRLEECVDQKSSETPASSTPTQDHPSIFLNDAAPLSEMYTWCMTPRLADMMWEHARDTCNIIYSRMASVPALRPPKRTVLFRTVGVPVTDWIVYVSKYVPAIFELPNDTIFKHPYIDQEILKSAIDSPEATMATTAETRLLRLARSFQGVRQSVRNAAGHTIYQAVVYAASPEEYSTIYNGQNLSQFDDFHLKVNSIIAAYAFLSNQSRRSQTRGAFNQQAYAPLVFFLVSGLQGVFFGPTHSPTCPPAGAALLLHLDKFASQGREPIWVRAELLITSKMREISISSSSDHTINKAELARSLAQDFLTTWGRRTDKGLPWILPSGIPNPSCPSCNLKHVFRD